MSIRHTSEAWEAPLPSTPKFVLLSLAFVCDDIGVAETSIGRIATMTGLSRRGVLAAISLLRDVGFLSGGREGFGLRLVLSIDRGVASLGAMYPQPSAPSKPKGYRKHWTQVVGAHGAGCAYCDEAATTLDHVVPRSRGGPDEPANLVPACRRCNSSKGARTPEEWRSGR